MVPRHGELVRVGEGAEPVAEGGPLLGRPARAGVAGEDEHVAVGDGEWSRKASVLAVGIGEADEAGHVAVFGWLGGYGELPACVAAPGLGPAVYSPPFTLMIQRLSFGVQRFIPRTPITSGMTVRRSTNETGSITPPEHPSHPTNPWPQAEARPLAIHEAAHAVAATATGYGRVRSVSIEGEFGTFGRAVLESLSYECYASLACSERGRRYLRAAYITSAAGPIAQELVGEPCRSWLEDRGLVDDGYPPSDLGDYDRVTSVADLLEISVEEAWEDAERLVRLPEVWGAIEAVASALVPLREQGRPAILDEVGYRRVIGDAYEALESLAFTSLHEAVSAASYW